MPYLEGAFGIVLGLSQIVPKRGDKEALHSVFVCDIGNLEYPDLLFLDTWEDAYVLCQFCHYSTRITGSPATVNTLTRAKPQGFRFKTLPP